MQTKADVARKLAKTARRTRSMGRLSDRQAQMVRHYFTDALLNRTEAMRLAGYTKAEMRNPRVEWGKPAVVAEAKQWADRLNKRYEVTYDKVIAELARVAFFNLSDVMKFDEETGEFVAISLDAASLDALAALGEVRVETAYVNEGDGPQPVRRVIVKPYNKIDALDKLMKHAGLSKHVEQLEVSVNLADRLRQGRLMMNAEFDKPDFMIDAEYKELRDERSPEPHRTTENA